MSFNRAEILQMIETETRQMNIAKERKEYDVVTWHQDGIAKWNNLLKTAPESSNCDKKG